MTSKPSKTLDDLTATQKEHIVRLFLQGEPIASSTTIAPSVIENVIRETLREALAILLLRGITMRGTDDDITTKEV